MRTSDMTVQQVKVGWMARSLEHGVAAVGETETEAVSKLGQVLETMRRLTTRRLGVMYNVTHAKEEEEAPGY